MSIAYPLILLLAQAGAQAPGASQCEEPVTQQAMNYCAGLEFEEADAELNRQWGETRAAMRRLDAQTSPDDGRPAYFAQLRRGQRAWLVFRDQHCASVGYGARGGSLEPLLVANCKTELTRARTEQLRELAERPE